MTTDHTVRSYDEELKRLDNLIAEMGGLAEDQFAQAMDALIRRDLDKAPLVAANDARIDALETQVDRQSIAMLARRQPLAPTCGRLSVHSRRPVCWSALAIMPRVLQSGPT